jgi:putative spermidine/putrescine transport system permease protein
VLLLILALVTRGRRRTAMDPAVGAPTTATQPGVPT